MSNLSLICLTYDKTRDPDYFSDKLVYYLSSCVDSRS